jgi:hypothetical protein
MASASLSQTVTDLTSTHTALKRVAYWVCTGLVVFFILPGGLAYALQAPDVVQGAVALGFPVHFVVLLGICKVLGSLTIAVPRFPLLKEWAYAGISFDLIGAASAAFATSHEWWHVAAPLSIGLLLAASWALRPESRRLPPVTKRNLIAAQL